MTFIAKNNPAESNIASALLSEAGASQVRDHSRSEAQRTLGSSWLTFAHAARAGSGRARTEQARGPKPPSPFEIAQHAPESSRQAPRQSRQARKDTKRGCRLGVGGGGQKTGA